MSVRISTANRMLRRGFVLFMGVLLLAAGLASLSSATAIAASALPDGRVLEMVTPTENYNADVYIPDSMSSYRLGNQEGLPTARPFQVSSDGEAVAYVGEATVDGSGLSGDGGGTEYLAARGAAGGWAQTTIQPEGYSQARFQAFSSDLKVGFLTAPGPGLSPEAPGEGFALYARETAGGGFHALFTEAAEREFGHGIANGERPIYAGYSADLNQSLFEDTEALTLNATDSESQPNSRWQGRNLYDSTTGQLDLVNVLPGGTVEPNATFGGIGDFQEYEQQHGDFSHVISADGSKIFWTGLTSGDLYVRENPTQPQSPRNGQGQCTVSEDACTVQVDSGVGGGGRYATASTDGSQVFFTKGALYEYNVETGSTTDLSESAGIEGVLGASEDGSYVYFVEYGGGLYVEHDGGSPKYITTLAPEDLDAANPYRGGNCAECGLFVGDSQPSLSRQTAEVAPSGDAVVFMSREDLTSYQAGGLDEVFVYEAQGAGRLFCASCAPDGEPPQSGESSPLVGAGAAAFLPISFSNTYLPSFISDDGSRVFFNSEEPLVAQDTNGKQDVYEWERSGSGTCHEEAGCVYLLSGGTSSSGSWLLGAGSSGDDVFLVTRAPLAPQDQNENDDLYDARVDGVLPVAAPACTGTGCQGVPAPPPPFATPPSVTFSGVGDFPPPPATAIVRSKQKTHTRAQRLVVALKACTRDRQRHKRVTCRAEARRRYGPAKASEPRSHKSPRRSKGRS